MTLGSQLFSQSFSSFFFFSHIPGLGRLFAQWLVAVKMNLKLDRIMYQGDYCDYYR